MATLTLMMYAAPAYAWDGATTGKIVGLDVVTSGQNFGFRIYMDGRPMCGTSEAWAYLNKDRDNYDAMVSLLTSVYLTGKNVTILTMKNGIYCEIEYAQFR